MIQAGRVQVNGRRVTEQGVTVDPVSDSVSLDGKILKIRRTLMVALNKPPGYVCTRRDESSRKVVSELLPTEWRELYPVGRLDRDTEGLLFLTNDGDFCLRMTHPRFGVSKRYVARAVGRLTESMVRRLVRGVGNRGERLRAVRAILMQANASHSLVELDLVEGKNREVRRMFEALGFEVDRLRRTRIGPIGIGELPLGKWRTLTREEIETLRRLTASGPDDRAGPRVARCS